jgi:hypothetical protein
VDSCEHYQTFVLITCLQREIVNVIAPRIAQLLLIYSPGLHLSTDLCQTGM